MVTAIVIFIHALNTHNSGPFHQCYSQGLIHVEGRCSPVQTLATSGLALCITLMLLCNFSLVDMLITGCRKELASDLYQPLGSNFGNSFYFFFLYSWILEENEVISKPDHCFSFPVFLSAELGGRY